MDVSQAASGFARSGAQRLTNMRAPEGQEVTLFEFSGALVFFYTPYCASKLLRLMPASVQQACATLNGSHFATACQPQ